MKLLLNLIQIVLMFVAAGSYILWLYKAAIYDVFVLFQQYYTQ